MAFGVGAVITNKGKVIEAKRMCSNSQEVPRYMGFGSGATSNGGRTAAVGDTALTVPVSSSGTTERVTSTITNTTTTLTNDTFTAVATFTAANTTTLNEIGLFDAASGGNMFASLTIDTLSLNPTDTLTYTISVQYAQ